MEELDQNIVENKAPKFLKALSILSFITIGFGLLGSLIGFISGKLSADEMEQIMAQSASQIEVFQNSGMNEFAEIFTKVYRMQEYINSNFYIHNLINLLSLVLGLFGVIYMLKGFKKGFHLYILYNLSSLLLVYVSVPVSEVPNFMIIVNLVISGLFIFLYSRNLSWMTK